LTLRELIGKTERRLKAARVHFGHGTGNAHDEAAFLVLRGFGLPFDADLERAVEPSGIENILKKRIEERVPAGYLLNEAWLDGLPFYVDRRVIIPRSHIAFLLSGLDVAPRRILDLCTGSGCLAVLAARAFPRAEVHASDISADALAVAARNVRKHRLEKRIRLVHSDLFKGLGKDRYDLILSNPPYVSTPSMRRLPPEYRHEPGIALGGGAKGLDFVARILSDFQQHLNPGGMLVCEIGDNQRALERAYPRTSFRWPLPEVFILAASRTGAASRKRPRQAQARR
jgi:ribosomal protein L3 glutamine methyltransferase